MSRPLTDFVLKRMACHQIHSLMDKGVEVDRLKSEWKRRWGLEYPFIKTMSGVKKDR